MPLTCNICGVPAICMVGTMPCCGKHMPAFPKPGMNISPLPDALPMATRKKRFTKAQQAWVDNYYGVTGFEPIMDDFLSGRTTFYENAREQVRWYEDHSIGALHSICRDIPGYEAHHYPKEVPNG